MRSMTLVAGVSFILLCGMSDYASAQGWKRLQTFAKELRESAPDIVEHIPHTDSDAILTELRNHGVSTSGKALYSLHVNLSSGVFRDISSRPSVFFLVDIEGQGAKLVPQIHHRYGGEPTLDVVLAEQIRPGSKVVVRLMIDETKSDAWNRITKSRSNIQVTTDTQATEYFSINGATPGQFNLLDGTVKLKAEDLAAMEFVVPITHDGLWVSEFNIQNDYSENIGELRFATLWLAPSELAVQQAKDKSTFAWVGFGCFVGLAILMAAAKAFLTEAQIETLFHRATIASLAFCAIGVLVSIAALAISSMSMNRSATNGAIAAQSLPSDAIATGPKWARDMFEVTQHDFEVVPRRSKTEYEFKFTNKYKENVHVASVRTSSKCTIPRIGKNELKTYEEGSIIAELNASDFVGARSAVITVVFDRPFPAELQLIVKGSIRSDILQEPGEIQFGEVALGSEKVTDVKVAYVGAAKWEIIDILSKNEHLAVKLSPPKTVGRKIEYVMTVRLKDDAPAGKFLDEIVLVTNETQSNRVTLPVRSNVIPPLFQPIQVTRPDDVIPPSPEPRTHTQHLNDMSFDELQTIYNAGRDTEWKKRRDEYLRSRDALRVLEGDANGMPENLYRDSAPFKVSPLRQP